jgi:hypothetical protein
MLRISSAVSVALFSVYAFGQTFTLPEMERVLLPVTVSGVNGAFGSKWSTKGMIFIDVAPPETQYVFPLEGCEFPSCEPIVGAAGRRAPLGFFPTIEGEPSGSLLYVQRSISDRVFVSLRLEQGTNGPSISLPVVRERDFFMQRFQIIDVPDAGPSHRLTLRVYGIRPELIGQIRVRIFGISDTDAVRDDIFTLSSHPHNYTTASFSVGIRPPSFDVQYYLPVSFPPSPTLRFEIEPLTTEMPIWAFVSITDNATQEVSLRVPR